MCLVMMRFDTCYIRSGHHNVNISILKKLSIMMVSACQRTENEAFITPSSQKLVVMDIYQNRFAKAATYYFIENFENCHFYYMVCANVGSLLYENGLAIPNI